MFKEIAAQLGVSTNIAAQDYYTVRRRLDAPKTQAPQESLEPEPRPIAELSEATKQLISVLLPFSDCERNRIIDAATKLLTDC